MTLQRATLNLEIVTPCFLAGADQEAVPEWRAASVRGQLRWWFRAVAGAEHGGDLRRVRELEESIFGSTERVSPLRILAVGVPGYHKRGTQPFQKRCSAQQIARLWGLDPQHRDFANTVERLTVRHPRNRTQVIDTDPLQYLGYGCVDIQGLARPCIAPEERALLRLQWAQGRSSAPDATTWSLFRRALWAWLHLGGIGSKARNGYGSLRCTRIEGRLGPGRADFHLATNRTEYESAIGTLLESVRDTGPARLEARWTQLGPDTTVHVGCEGKDTWEEALTLAGAWIIAYRRRYGSPADPRARNGQSLANRDYAWASPRGGSSKRRKGIPDRAGFGLPLPFSKDEQVTWWNNDDRRDRNATPHDHRRASPLHIHIARLDGGHLPVFTHIPSQFLPQDGELAYRNHPDPSLPPNQAQLGIIEHFLDDLATKKLVRRIEP